MDIVVMGSRKTCDGHNKNAKNTFHTCIKLSENESQCITKIFGKTILIIVYVY